jgi:response regulator of citrate/malate metabolism
MTTNVRVMILEDDIRASYTLESTINQQKNFQVVAVCETCAEAKLQFDLFHPELVFVDITLPDGNGIELIKEWREQNVHSHFIMTTAVRETNTIERAVHLGVIDYLVKPIRMSRVIQSLDDYSRYQQTLVANTTVGQEDIDLLLRKPNHKPLRQTPKGIDVTTLAALKTYLITERPDSFSSEEVGERMNFSRITARRYLEYLESEGMLRLELDYNTGGRPRRLYKLV